MIEYKQGSIFDSTCEVLTAPVNCEGIAGKGLALQFKKRFPPEFFIEPYRQICMADDFRPGRVAVLQIAPVLNLPWILFFPTKIYWSHPSKIEYIQKGLEALQHACSLKQEGFTFTSLALPALGCGLGGLPYADVREEIEHYLKDLPLHIEVYEPHPIYETC